MSDPVERRSWAAARGLVALTWAVAVAGAAWCAGLWTAGGDPAGRLIAGVAALGCGAMALFGTRARPRLAVDPGGLTIGGLRRARHHPWPFVHDVRVTRTRRWGRESVLLEIDTVTAAGDERLWIFGRLDLDEDPETVAQALARAAPQFRRGV